MFNTCIGAIAEEKIKLQIHIADFEFDFQSPFKNGDKVEVLGRFIMGGKK